MTWRPASEISEPGWYWMRYPENPRRMSGIVYFHRRMGESALYEYQDFEGTRLGYFTGRELAGPLTPPESTR